MTIYKLTIFKAPISTNHAYGSRGKIRYLSKAGKEYKIYAKQLAIDSKIPKMEGDEIFLSITNYFPDNRRRDAANYEKLISDSFIGVFYDDDSQIRTIKLSKSVDKNNPRTEIIITNNENNLTN